MEFGRRQLNLTVLADGSVLATGGNSSGASLADIHAGVYNAELWSPDTGHWKTLAAEDATRQYHSTALLLPDARVLSAGGGICGTCDTLNYLSKSGQVFSPPYLFKQDGTPATRPVISAAPNHVTYGKQMTIPSPDATSIKKMAMVRLGSVTHSVNMEQRYVPLDYTVGNGRITATSPANANVAPPGPYMLFVIDSDGVPSMAKMVSVDLDAGPAPIAPSIGTTAPRSPANDRNPRVIGTATGASTVTIYSGAGCSTGTLLATGSADQFESLGVPVAVSANTATDLWATATDSAGITSVCSQGFTYTEDSTPPAAPSITALNPTSPANNRSPKVIGTADAGSTVTIYSGTDCSGPVIGSGSNNDFAPGIEVTVSANATTTLRAMATDNAGNASPCSSAVSYTEDSAPPTAPSITDTDPDSPANDDHPEAKGTAENGSTVRVYSGADCNGAVLATGSAATFTSSGITVPVGNDTSTDLRVTATDDAANVSPCSSALTYVEDSTGPDTAAEVDVEKSTATATFSSEAGATFECNMDAAGYSACQSPTSWADLAPGNHSLAIRATDLSGNPDTSPAEMTFMVEKQGAGAPVDRRPPKTTINKKPKAKGTRGRAVFRFGSSEPRSTFRCRLDGEDERCGYRLVVDVGRGRHRITVAAIDPSGNVDRSPARYSWRVKRSSGKPRVGDELIAVASAAVLGD